MGGIGAAVRQSAISLAAAGHDVHVFTFTLSDDVKLKLPRDVTVHEVSDLAGRVHIGDISAPLAAAIQGGGEGVYRLTLGSLLCDALLRVHQKEPFDIVEAPEVEALGLPLLLMNDFGAPVVTHLHCSISIARMANGSAPGAEADLAAALEFAAIHLADAVCAPTKAVVKATRAFVPIAQNPRVIPHAFDCGDEKFVPPPVAGPVLFVGRIERLKGVETIAGALNDFLPRHPSATFRFVGPDTATGPGGQSMRQSIEARLCPDIRPRVRFAGELAPAQITAEWRGCRFGVMPSLWENFSMACCEAMAAGRTIIVSEGTGSVELIGEAGLVIERGSQRRLAAAMEQLWTDRGRAEQLSCRAYERIRQNLAPSTIARRRIDFYLDVIDAFRDRGRSNLHEKLMSLPPQCGAAILPGLAGITGRLCGTAPTAVYSPGTRLLRIMQRLECQSGQPAAVLLYGAGKHTARLLSERHVWESRRHRVVGIIDDHPRFAQTPVYLDLPVQSVDGVRARLMGGQPVPPVVLSTDTYQDQFWSQSAPLREAGVPVFRLY